MKFGYQKKMTTRIAVLFAALLMFCWAPDAEAQWRTKWLSVGELHHPYLSGGAEPENLLPDVYLTYPGIQTGASNNHWKGLWISARNVQDESGNTWDIRTSHIGPRDLGIGEFFDLSHLLLSRFDSPEVTVDGLPTFHRPVQIDETFVVDESLNPDRMVHSLINSSVGITVEKRAMQFSNEYHDNYHLIEYIFTNTGNQDDDEAIEVEQTLEDVFFTFLERPKLNAPSGSWDNSSGGMAWGQHVMNDNTGEGLSDYGVDFRSQFSWIGEIPDQRNYNTLGNPMWFNHQWNSVANDTLGRLGGATMVGNVVIHADAEAHAPGTNDAVFNTSGQPDHVAADDPAQPHTMTYIESDWSDITTGSSHTNEQKMALERNLIECGARGNPISVDPECAARTWPNHAHFVHGAEGDARQGEVDFIAHFKDQSSDPSLGRAGGWGFMNAYGPYTMEPGEQVKIVVAEGVAGLSPEAAWHVGRTFKLNGGDEELPIAFNAKANRPCNSPTEDGCVEQTKNEWALSARDSLFQMFERARAVYNAGYEIPSGPLPPNEFHVTSGTDQISLEWAAFPGAQPSEWEVWRAQKAYNGVVTALRVDEATGLGVPDSARAYQRIATLPGTASSYTDENVSRGLSYFYYLQAVGDVNTNSAGNTPTGGRLKSNRYYAQTYEPAFLRRSSGTELSQIRIVPNPYNLEASTDVRFGDKQDKIAFYGLPGQATIKIYTELGELVETIDHTDGSGDEFWFLTTYSRQLVASGIYLVVIENRDENSSSFGQQVIRKLIIIR